MKAFWLHVRMTGESCFECQRPCREAGLHVKCLVIQKPRAFQAGAFVSNVQQLEGCNVHK